MPVYAMLLVYCSLLIIFVTTVISFETMTSYRKSPLRSLRQLQHKKKQPIIKQFCISKFTEENMSVDEIISELDLRGVTYDDCTNKSSLARRLMESRTKGRADPSLIDKFIAADMEETFSKEKRDMDDTDLIGNITSTDGTLPGGMSPELVKQLTSDKDIMNMLKDTKMQDILKSVMTNGPDGMKKYLSDPDALLLLQKLSKSLAKATGQAK